MSNILQDTHNRNHTYLRISLTERCNLRCTYCMPAEKIRCSPKSQIMSCDEIYTIAKTFVEHGVTKIRLTGGEPFVRKDAYIILEKLATLPVTLAVTTNAINVARYIDTLKLRNIKKVNISLDTLNPETFKKITQYNYFEKVYRNIHRLIAQGFEVKMNVVLMKGINDNEIIDFINITKTLPVVVRFIEFMPFDGNKWEVSSLVTLNEILAVAENGFPKEKLIRLMDTANDTSKNYRIQDHKGSFAIISSVTKPFCDSCNRIRLTANGHLKNCLFSADEWDLLSPLREGKSIAPIIKKAIEAKQKNRGGMDTIEKLKTPDLHNKNRSMITIGG